MDCLKKTLSAATGIISGGKERTYASASSLEAKLLNLEPG